MILQEWFLFIQSNVFNFLVEYEDLNHMKALISLQQLKLPEDLITILVIPEDFVNR